MRLEHANLSIVNTEPMTRFLQAVDTTFHIRGSGLDNSGRPWRHVGNDNFYVALQTVPIEDVREPYSNTPGLNHLGWEVDDIAALETRLKSAGFEPNMRSTEHPARTRLYFYDPDGNDWEFVQYHADNPNDRNDYSI